MNFPFQVAICAIFVLQNYPKAQSVLLYVHMYMCISATVEAHMCIHWRYLFLLFFQSAALSYDMCRERLKAKNLVYVMQILQILEGFLKFLKRKHHACHSNSWVIPTHLLSCSLPVLSYRPKRMRVASGSMYINLYSMYAHHCALLFQGQWI